MPWTQIPKKITTDQALPVDTVTTQKLISESMKINFSTKTDRLLHAIARNEWDTEAWVSLLHENKDYDSFLKKFPTAVLFFSFFFFILLRRFNFTLDFIYFFIIIIFKFSRQDSGWSMSTLARILSRYLNRVCNRVLIFGFGNSISSSFNVNLILKWFRKYSIYSSSLIQGI